MSTPTLTIRQQAIRLLEDAAAHQPFDFTGQVGEYKVKVRPSVRWGKVFGKKVPQYEIVEVDPYDDKVSKDDLFGWSRTKKQTIEWLVEHLDPEKVADKKRRQKLVEESLKESQKRERELNERLAPLRQYVEAELVEMIDEVSLSFKDTHTREEVIAAIRSKAMNL